MQVQPYLYFNGHCEEAMEFYRNAVGAKITTLTRFKDNPGAPAPADAGEKVMHAEIAIGDTSVLASDGQCSGATDFKASRCRLPPQKMQRRIACLLHFPTAAESRFR